MPEHILEEIDELYQAVPELKQHFEVTKKIGEGTFSSVFQAKLRNHPHVDRLFALKHIVPTSHPSRVVTELKCLQECGGKHNVMGMDLCIRNNDQIVIGMPYFTHDRFQDCLPSFDPEEIQCYMKNLLIALSHVHKYNIIHRDVKPSNFLFNRETKQFSLVDFGLAHKVTSSPKKSKLKSDVSHRSQRIVKNSTTIASDLHGQGSQSLRQHVLLKRTTTESTQFNRAAHTCQCLGKPKVCHICLSRTNQVVSRAGTPGFRAPEVLLKYPSQTTSVDIWSAGVIFLSLLSSRYPFFKANDDLTALAQMITLMGSVEMKNAAKTIGKDIISFPYAPALNLKDLCIKLRSSGPDSQKSDAAAVKCLKSSKKFIDTVGDDAFNLLHKLLDLNPETRIKAKDALKHHYFSIDYGTNNTIASQKTNKTKAK
ncbi:cell division cycle 7-related protein kinase-like [Argonauta hians]